MTENFKLNSIKLLLQRNTILKSILFLIGLFLTLVQNWVDPILIICPIVSFGFALFFQIIESNKHNTEIKDSFIYYEPIGEEGKNSNVLSIFSYLQIFLIFIMGLDSLLHPQLIDNFFLFFLIPLFFSYELGFFLLLLRVMNNSKIKIDLENINSQLENDLNNNDEKNLMEGMLSFLSVKSFKKYSLYNLALFFLSLIFTMAFSFLTFFDLTPGIPFYLPGTGIEGSNPVNISWMLYVGIFTPPIYTIWFLFQIFKKIVNFSNESLNNIKKNIIDDSKKSVLLKILNLNEHK